MAASTIAPGIAAAQGGGCIQQVNQLSKQAMDAYVQFDTNALTYVDQALGLAANPQCTVPQTIVAKLHVYRGIVLYYFNGDSTGALEEFKAALTIDYGVTPDPQFMSAETADIWSYWTLAKKTVPAKPPLDGGTSDGGGYDTGLPPMGGMIIHQPVTEQNRKTPIPIAIQVNPSLIPSVESVTLYFQLPGETIWSSKEMDEGDGGTFTARIDCADGMYIFDPASVSYYIVVSGQGGTVLASEPVGQAMAPHVVKLVEMLAGQPPMLPGSGPEEKCREVTCFSNKECVKELGEGSTCFEGICSVPDTAKDKAKHKKDKKKKKGGGGGGAGGGGGGEGKGFPGLILITLGATPAASFGLVTGNAYKGAPIDTGFAWGGAALRFSFGYYLKMGIGFSGYFRMGLLTGKNVGMDDDFDQFSGGVRVNYMAVRRKIILVGVFLGVGYGQFRHKLKDIPNQCWDMAGVFHYWPPSCDYTGKPDDPSTPTIDESLPPKLTDYWRAAGLFDINVGATILIRPTKVFGIPIEVAVDFLAPTFAMNIDVSLGIAFYFGGGFEEKDEEPAGSFSDPMTY